MKKVDLNLSTKMLKKQKEALKSVPQIPEEQGQTFVCLAMKKQQRNL
jgi:hypothetical protein